MTAWIKVTVASVCIQMGQISFNSVFGFYLAQLNWQTGDGWLRNGRAPIFTQSTIPTVSILLDSSLSVSVRVYVWERGVQNCGSQKDTVAFDPYCWIRWKVIMSSTISERVELAKLCSSRNWSKAIRILDSLLSQSCVIQDLWSFSSISTLLAQSLSYSIIFQHWLCPWIWDIWFQQSSLLL